MNRISAFNPDNSEEATFVLDVKRRGEYYAFIVANTIESIQMTLRTVGRFANPKNSQSSFTWQDAEQIIPKLQEKLAALMAKQKSAANEFGPPEGF